MPVNPEDYNSDAISGEKLLALMQDEVYDRLKGDVPESLAVFLCSLKAQVDSIQKVISEKNLGECVADSIDAQNLSVKGEGVKIRQNPVNTYSTDSTKVSQFVDSVTQNENGEIVVHKRDVRQSSTSQSGIVQLYDGVDSSSSSLAASALAAKTANETTLNMSRSGAITGKLHIDQLDYPTNNRMVRVTDSSRTVDAGALVPDPGYNNAGHVLSVGNYGDLVWDGIHAGVSLSANGTQVQLLDGNNQVLSTVNIESTGGLTYKGAITPTEWNPVDGEIGIGTPAAVRGDMYIASQAGYVNGFSLQGGSIIICKVASVPAAVPQDPPGTESWNAWNAQYPNTWDFIDINASASGNKIDGPATSSPNQMVLFDNNFGNIVKAGPTFNPSTGVLDVTVTAAYGYVVGGAIAQALNSKAADSHVHGNITNDGKMNTAVAIGSGDCLLIRDASDNNIIKAATVNFDGSTDDSFLSKKGIWSNTVKYAKDYASGGTIGNALT
ncbi:MAG: tail fiber protein, partial [Bacteroidales bacterium]|nr:tail fiber protein [Bacteroidales bacterium]